MKFQSLLDPKVDMKEYNDGWLINDVMYVATPITEDCFRLLLELDDLGCLLVILCPKSWRLSLCFQSAYMQHGDNLQLLGQRITKRQPKSSSSSKRRKLIADALKAAGERIGGQNRNGVK
ncbi:hypothetical protein IV203_032304 [Nitzschia inconspicua]|uniref:Uncharacterized protein n=1 Tax=Nitzschia inconspicua TaxID=303405 RepID=A0A9K3PEU8_9STRA|nr:hypothetical protein IV203_032304 [Nitzschia inconspicua]